MKVYCMAVAMVRVIYKYGYTTTIDKICPSHSTVTMGIQIQ